MRRRAAAAWCCAALLASGCAEVLGLEPAVVGTGSGGTGGTGTTGTGGATVCTQDADCPSASLGACEKAVCVEGKCQSTPSCTGEILDVIIHAAPGLNDFRGVAIGPGGEVYVTGVYTQATALFDCALTPAPFAGAFLARLTPNFKCEWVTTLTSDGDFTSLSQIAIHDGVVWAVGSVLNNTSLNDAHLLEYTFFTSTIDAIVVGVDSTGGFVDAFHISGTATDQGVALASGDHLYALVEGQSGSITSAQVGQNISYSTPDLESDIVLFGLSGNKLDFYKSFGSALADVPRAVAQVGDKVFAGGFMGATSSTIDGCTLAPGGEMGKAFAINFDKDGAEGNTVCASFGGMGEAITTAIAGRPDGAFALAGFSSGPADIECATGGTSPTANAWLRVGDTGATCASGVVLTDPDESRGEATAFDGSTVLFGGTYSGKLGDASAIGQDIFIHRYSDDLDEQIWHQEFGSDDTDELGGFAVSPVDGSIVVVGSCLGKDFAKTGQMCDPFWDGFLVRLAP